MDIKDVQKILDTFVKERDWERFHEPKDLALAILIEGGELGEHFLWKSKDESREYLKHDGERQLVLDEIADIMIYCIHFMNAIERITGNSDDIISTLVKKNEKNEKKYPASIYRQKARLDKPTRQ